MDAALKNAKQGHVVAEMGFFFKKKQKKKKKKKKKKAKQKSKTKNMKKKEKCIRSKKVQTFLVFQM